MPLCIVRVQLCASPALMSTQAWWIKGSYRACALHVASPAAAALVAGFIWLMTDAGIAGVEVRWVTFALTLYAGLTMVTNVPFYSFKDISMKRSVPFAVIVLIALGIAVINIHPPTVMFGLFILYGLSGYVVYGYRKAKGLQTSVISTSTDEPDERGLHK